MAIEHCEILAADLARDLKDAQAVMTHPYEHGHPDHDTAALAVRLAGARLASTGQAAPRQ